VHYDVTSNFCGKKIQTIVLNGNEANASEFSKLWIRYKTTGKKSVLNNK
jgi:hypothetical protein